MQDAPAHPPRIFNDICAPSGLTDDQKLALYTNLIRDGTMDIDSTVAPVDDQILFLARSAFCERIVIAVWITYAEKHGINDPVAMRVLSIAYDRAGVPIFKTLLQTDTFVAWPEQKRMATIRAIIDTVVSSTNTENVYSVDQTIRDIRILAKMIQLVAPFVNGHFAPPTSCMGHLLVAYTCTPFEQREKYATLFNAQALTAAKQLVVPVFTNTSISPSTRRTFIAAAAVLRKTPTGFLTPFFIDIIDAVAPASACMAAMADIFSAIPYTEQRVLPVQWDALFNIEHTHVPITSRLLYLHWKEPVLAQSLFKYIKIQCASPEEALSLRIAVGAADGDDDAAVVDDDSSGSEDDEDDELFGDDDDAVMSADYSDDCDTSDDPMSDAV